MLDKISVPIYLSFPVRWHKIINKKIRILDSGKSYEVHKSRTERLTHRERPLERGDFEVRLEIIEGNSILGRKAGMYKGPEAEQLRMPVSQGILNAWQTHTKGSQRSKQRPPSLL